MWGSPHIGRCRKSTGRHRHSHWKDLNTSPVESELQSFGHNWCCVFSCHVCVSLSFYWLLKCKAMKQMLLGQSSQEGITGDEGYLSPVLTTPSSSCCCCSVILTVPYPFIYKLLIHWTFRKCGWWELLVEPRIDS